MNRLIRSLILAAVLLPGIAAAQPVTMPPNTVWGRLGIGPGPGSAISIASLLGNAVGPNSVANSQLALTPAATFKCNPTIGTADVQDCTIQGLTARGTPDSTNDKILLYDNAAGTLKFVTPAQVAGVNTSGVSLLNSLSGSLAIAAGTNLTVTPSGSTITLALNFAGTYVWTGPHIFKGNALFGSGDPWVDVKSGANGCAGAVGNNSNNDTSAIQCQITYMNTTYGGGTVFFPPGNYLVSGGGLAIPAGIWLKASSMDSTSIQVASDSIVLQFSISGGACPSGGLNGGIDRISIYGYQNTGASQPAILVGANCEINIFNSRVWFGSFGLATKGSDGTVFNSFICGYQGCVQSNGANWYVRTKFDHVAAGLPTTYGFLQGTNAAGLTLAENHFDQVDFSCSCTYSLYIDDGANTSITGITNAVFDSAIFINHARFVQISNSEVGSTSFTINAGTLMMTTTGAFNGMTITGAGGKSCAANAGFTNC